MANSRFLYVLIILLFSVSGMAQNGNRIKELSRNNDTALQNFEGYEDLSQAERRQLRRSLRNTKELMEDMGLFEEPMENTVICQKWNNGKFYPTDIETNSILGSNGGNAGHNSLDQCKKTLPENGSPLACFKWNNSKYYITNTETHSIAGSSGGNAGHNNIDSCTKTLPEKHRVLACMKWNNNKYYPSNPELGEIIGSNGGNAGYDNMSSCRATL